MLLTLACTDRSPTQPGASLAAADVKQAESGQTIRLSRPSTRNLPARKTFSGAGVALQQGSWGTAQQEDLSNVLLTVTSAGATLQSECANGVIEQPILVDASGRFDVLGTYLVQVGPVGQPSPARFLGSVGGGVLALKVVLTNDGRAFGPFTLTFGQAPRIGTCPIV